MGSKSHIGKRKVGFVTFFLLLIVTILIFIIHQSFFVSEHKLTEEYIPIQNTQSLTENENVNVTVQRYYASLPLLSDEDKKGDYSYHLNELNKDYNDLNVEEDVISTEAGLEKEVLVEDVVQPIKEEIIAVEPTIDSPVQVEENLFDDSSWDDWGSVSELLPPTLFEPLIQTQEEYDMFNPAVTEDVTYDDDFFSDFYVAGEDDAPIFPDGYYYLQLNVNEELLGEIEVQFKEGDYYLNSQGLYDFVYNRLSDAAIDRIFGDADVYISLNELIEKGVEASIDLDAFAVNLVFSLDDMPLIIIPVSEVDKQSKILKNNQYGINDASLIEPEFISAVSAVNLYGNYSYGSLYSGVLNPFTINMYMNNSVSVGAIEFSFSNNFAYTFGSTTNPLSYDFGSWSGAYSYYDKNLRLTFGQVGGSLISGGTPIGFTLEKTYSYGKQSALPHQFTRHFVIEDLATINIYLNDEVIFSKRVKQGEYKFIDFSFKDGANLLIFDIDYDDDDKYEDIHEQYDIAYDSSLLARGDYLYGLSGAIHKTIVDDTTKSLFVLPYFNGSWYEYNFSDIEMTYWMNVGLTDEFTMLTSLSLASDVMTVSFEGLLATLKGSYNGSVNIGLQNNLTPSADLSLSHTYQTKVGPISANLSLSVPEFERPSYDLSSDGSISLSLGYTFNIWELPPLSTSFNVSATNSEISTSSSVGLSYSPATGLSISSSLTATTSTINDPTFAFSVSLNYSLIKNMSTSTSFSSEGTSSISASYKAGLNDSLQFSVSNINYTEANRPSYSATWAHTGDNSSLSIRQTASDNFTDLNTNASLSSTLYYAGGLFGISGTTSSNFLLLKPKGKLAGSQLSISKTNNSTPTLLDSIFGTSVYTELTADTKNNIIIYGEVDSLYSSGGSFSYELNTNTRTGFAKRMTVPVTYTVSGLLYDVDGKPFAQYSSPVYTRQEDEFGNYYLQISENQYLFTDANGRYILNDVAPGYYVFDLQVDKSWYAISFQIPDNENNDGKIIELEDYRVEDLSDDILSWDLSIEAEKTDSSAQDFAVDTFGNKIVSEYAQFEFILIKDIVDEETFAMDSQQEFEPTGFEKSISNGDEFVAPEVDPFADTASEWVDDSDSWSF